MPSKYNQEQKKANLKLAQEMADTTFPALNKDGSIRTIIRKGGIKQAMGSFHYDPHHIKKICKLNTMECRVLGIYKTSLQESIAAAVSSKVRKGFRTLNNNLKEKATRIKQRKTQRIARRAARGA